MNDDIYEVFARRYGHSDRRSPENFIGGDAHDVPMPLDYYNWVIRNDARTIVVDTGFDQASANKRKRELLRPVDPDRDSCRAQDGQARQPAIRPAVSTRCQ